MAMPAGERERRREEEEEEKRKEEERKRKEEEEKREVERARRMAEARALLQPEIDETERRHEIELAAQRVSLRSQQALDNEAAETELTSLRARLSRCTGLLCLPDTDSALLAQSDDSPSLAFLLDQADIVVRHGRPVTRQLVFDIASASFDASAAASDHVAARTHANDELRGLSDAVEALRAGVASEETHAPLIEQASSLRGAVTAAELGLAEAQQRVIDGATDDLIGARDAARSLFVDRCQAMLAVSGDLEHASTSLAAVLDRLRLAGTLDGDGHLDGGVTVQGAIDAYESCIAAANDPDVATRWQTETAAVARVQEIAETLQGLAAGTVEWSDVQRLQPDAASQVDALDGVLSDMRGAQGVLARVDDESLAPTTAARAITSSLPVEISAMDTLLSRVCDLLVFCGTVKAHVTAMELFDGASSRSLAEQLKALRRAALLAQNAATQKRAEVTMLDGFGDDTSQARAELTRLRQAENAAITAFQSYFRLVAIASADHFPELRAENESVSRVLDLDGLWQECRSLSQYELLGDPVTTGQHAVYQARLPGTAECVALKEYTLGKKQFDRLLCEARHLRRAAHPSVAALNGVWMDTETNKAYIEMPWYDGGNLRDWMATSPSDQRKQRVMLAVGQGLEHLHLRGILHLDMKPENVMMDKDGRPIIADFDISKDVAARTMAIATLTARTPYFACPDPVGSAAYDMYQYGLLLFFVHFPDTPLPQPTPTIELPDHTNAHLVGLIKALLDLDPGKRPTAQQALAHPYFTESLVVESEAVERELREAERRAAELAEEQERYSQLLRDVRGREAEQRTEAERIRDEERRLRHRIWEENQRLRQSQEALRRMEQETGQRAEEARRKLQRDIESQRREMAENRRRMEEQLKADRDTLANDQRQATEQARKLRNDSHQVQSRLREADATRRQAQRDARAAADAQRAALPPSYWETSLMSTGVRRVPVTQRDVIDGIQRLLDRTCRPEFIGVGRDSHGLRHKGFELISVERVENPTLWRFYSQKRAQIVDRRRPADVRVLTYSRWTRHQELLANEFFFFHGLRPEAVDVVATDGFDERVCSLGGLFGAGVYFAENSSKSDEYIPATADHCITMLLCRVTLGNPFVAAANQASFRQIRRPPCANGCLTPCLHARPYDSVLAEIKANDARAWLEKYREFVVYDGRQAYPEYVLRVRRVDDVRHVR